MILWSKILRMCCSRTSRSGCARMPPTPGLHKKASHLFNGWLARAGFRLRFHGDGQTGPDWIVFKGLDHRVFQRLGSSGLSKGRIIGFFKGLNHLGFQRYGLAWIWTLDISTFSKGRIRFRILDRSMTSQRCNLPSPHKIVHRIYTG